MPPLGAHAGACLMNNPSATGRLADLGPGATAVVTAVEHVRDTDAIAARLEDLGFVSGECLRVIARGPVGGDPMVVQVGSTRFALRRSEAARVWVNTEDVACTLP
jgi:ferrous iron transport protein A